MTSRFFLPYEAAVRWQKKFVARRIAREIPDILLLVEHEPVVTMGASSTRAQLLLSPEEFKQRGIKLIHTDRGGAVTYHGPGQLILYPILRLDPADRDPHDYLHRVRLRACWIEIVGALEQPGALLVISVYEVARARATVVAR